MLESWQLRPELVMAEIERLHAQPKSSLAGVVIEREDGPIIGDRDWSETCPSCPWPRGLRPKQAVGLEPPLPAHRPMLQDRLDTAFKKDRVWYPLVARPSREQDAADWLKRAMLPTYWPCYLKAVNAGRRVRNGFGVCRHRYTALMPGLLFMAVAADRSGRDPWDVVNEAPGLHGFVRDSDKQPMVMFNEDIEIIRLIEAGMNLPLPTKTNHRFKVGDRVRFIDDILGRWPSGKVIGLVNGEGISVEVPMLGRFVAITARAHQIEAM